MSQSTQNCKRILLDKIAASNLIARGYSAAETARELGVTRQTIYKFAKRHGLKPAIKVTGRPQATVGRTVCLKVKVPLAVKRWALKDLEAVQALLQTACDNSTGKGS